MIFGSSRFLVEICNNYGFVSSYRYIINQSKSNKNEFFSCIIGYSFSSPGGYRKRLWVVLNCSTFDFLWLGAWRYCCIGHIEQPKLEPRFMKLVRVFSTVLIAVFFVACNFTEEIHFNQDGTGKMNIGFDGGEMLQMLPSSDSTQLEEVIDSTIVFKDLIRENKDSIAQLSPKQQAELKKLEPFSLHMMMDAEKGIMNFDMFTDFKDVSEVNDAFNAFQSASSVGPTAGSKPMPKNSANEATEVSYSFKKDKFRREAVIKDKELFQQSIDSLETAEMFLSSSTYTFKYHFPKRVKSTNVEEATFSMDGKTMVYEVNFLDMLKDPESIMIEVELEK